MTQNFINRVLSAKFAKKNWVVLSKFTIIKANMITLGEIDGYNCDSLKIKAKITVTGKRVTIVTL